MSKEKIYELIWNLILFVSGVILSIVGYFIYPMIALVLVIGLFLVLYALFIAIKNIKKQKPLYCNNTNNNVKCNT